MDEPDEESNWSMIDNLHEYSAEVHDFVITGTDEGWDTQPDLFNFNFNGRSGRFVIERNIMERYTASLMKISKLNLIIQARLERLLLRIKMELNTILGDLVL